MPKLYLVGVTEDRTGLVLAKSPRAKTGESVLEVDGDVLDAVAEIRRYRSEGAVPPPISSPALPTRHRPTGEGPSASNLSPREIQSRLRRGESIESVARRAGIEAWRIEVYAAPIAAEQARIVARARELDVEKRGSGPSGRPLGDSVQASIVEKRVSMDVDEFESAWSAYEPEPDRWVVQFQYTSRGRAQLAEWVYDPEEETISATNRLATTLGWRDPKRPGRLPPLPEAPKREAPRTKPGGAKKKPSGAKKKPSGAKKKSATKKSATKKSATKKSATTKKSTPKKSTPRKSTPKKSTTRKKSATKKSATKKKSTTKKSAPRKKSAPKKKGSSGSSGGRGGARSRRSSSRSSTGSSKGKRSKSPPARLRGERGDDWRGELARRMAEDRSVDGDPPTGSWRVVARPPDGEVGTGSDDLEPPEWVQAPSSPDDATDTGSDEADEAPAPGVVRVVGRPVSGAPHKRGRRRFRRARRAG